MVPSLIPCLFFSFSFSNPPPTLPCRPIIPSLIPCLNNPSVCLCSLPLCFQIPRANMAARAPTRMTVARGSATSTEGCSRHQTTPTLTHPTRSVFTSWKVKPGVFPSERFLFCSVAVVTRAADMVSCLSAYCLLQ